MSVSGYAVGVLPGAGGSFAMTGIRPKITKHRVYTSSGVWIAPANCYFVQLAMCGGGGSGGVTSGSSSSGGSGAAAIAPSIIPVVPGTTYTVTVGAGGVGVVSDGTGNSGGESSFSGGILILRALGGSGGLGFLANLLGGSVVAISSFGAIGVSGGSVPSTSGAGVRSGSVEHALGGVSASNTGTGGGASLFSDGTNGASTSSAAGFGAGSGGANVASGAGGNGIVVLTWEE
jgi:hypothetical protein